MVNSDFQNTMDFALTYRTIELLGSGDALAGLIAEHLTDEASCVWIHGCDKRRDAFLDAHLVMRNEHFAETSKELIDLAQKAFKKKPRRMFLSLPSLYDGTRFSLIADLAALSEQNKGTQCIFLREATDARFAASADVRIRINKEKALIGHLCTTTIFKLAGYSKSLSQTTWTWTRPTVRQREPERTGAYRTTRALLFN